MMDPYVAAVCRWWHLSVPLPEMLGADADGWRGPPGAALDIGCGLGTEIAYLPAHGWHAAGADLPEAALARARSAHGGAPFVQADVLALPFPAGAFGVALDRGCFHYLDPSQWAGYGTAICTAFSVGQGV